MLTLAEFRVRFPEFTEAVIGNTPAQAMLDEAELEIGAAYEDEEDRAHGYLAAHLAACWVRDAASAGKAASTGAVSSMSVPGAISVSFNLDDPVKLTTYGRRYADIRDRVGKGAFAGGGNSAAASFINTVYEVE